MRRRLAAVIVATVLLAFAALSLTEVDRDVRGLIGTTGDIEAALDTYEGRSQTIAIVHPDADRRSAVARDLSTWLRDHPMVAEVRAGPEAAAPALLDWLWQARLLLAPPTDADLTPAGMARNLSIARQALTRVAEAPLAPRYLLDPTGSFRRLVEAAATAAPLELPVHTGVRQSLDGSAALVFLTQTPRPFDLARQAALDAAIADRVSAAGAEALNVGPRSISARISAHISTRAIVASVIGGALVLLWLGLLLRPPLALAMPFLPVAFGALVGVLAVQTVFGSVHAVAIGFGAPILGLALDYPLHLIGQEPRRTAPGPTARKIAIGAGTTAIAFLGLTLSGVSAMGQAGVFVAVGLVSAATVSVWLFREAVGFRIAGAGLTFGFGAKSLRSRGSSAARSFLLVACAGASVLFLALTQTGDEKRLVEIPETVGRDIARLDAMVDLPSGRFGFEVGAEHLDALAARLRTLSEQLDKAVAAGALSRHASLGRALPPRSDAALPTTAEFAAATYEALSLAGLAPAFAGQIVEAYAAAARPGETIVLFPSGVAPFGWVRKDGERLVATVALWDVVDPAALAALATGDVVLLDREAPLTRQLRVVMDRVLVGLALGALCAGLVLLAIVRPLLRAAEIVLACTAASLVTAALAVAITGTIGVFQIVALGLVAGIGIDYGLFITLAESAFEKRKAGHSVLACATTTLIAFGALALSGVGVLVDIGVTVIVGVVAMLAVHMLPLWMHGTESRQPP